jgi:drug/metabolite transporter (DMT)-like permease
MNWLVIVIIAHTINALVFVITKVLLDKYITNATVMTIFIGIFGAAAFVLAPWGLVMPSLMEFAVDFAAGVFFVIALLLFNYVLKAFESSRVVPIVGGAVPAFTFVLAFLFLNERLSLREIGAFALLVIGTIIISMVGEAKERLKFSGIIMALLAGLAFAASFVLTKYIFDTQPFISGFIWIRVGSFALAAILLLNPKTWQAMKTIVKKMSLSIKGAFVGQMILGALAFILINYAISLASVSLVNALQGVQYALLIILVIIGTKFFPKLIKERITGWILVQKIIAIGLISAGIAILAI